jgi:hypothetical protein
MSAGQFGEDPNFIQLFLPPTVGAMLTMTVFYFSSEYLMLRASRKKAEKRKAALAKGIVYKEKKKFTFINKTIVRAKMKLGILGVTILAPLFMSIPIGSVVCAKFYKHKKHTFLRMSITVVGYSLLMSSILFLFES